MLRNALFRRLLCLLALVMGGGTLTTPAQATITAWAFTGACTDCTGFSTGTLYLSDYTPGTMLQTSNFSEFTYTSNLVTYDITSVSAIFGSLSTVSGAAFVGFSNGPLAFASFNSGGTSPWCIGAGINCGADFGPTSSWTYLGIQDAVPEPAAWAMMVVGFGVAGSALRMNRRKVSFLTA